MKKLFVLLLIPLFASACIRVDSTESPSSPASPDPETDGAFIHISKGSADTHDVLMALMLADKFSTSNDVLVFFIIRRISLREDVQGGLESFKKLEHRSKVFIFIIIITFSFAMIDWIMSIDAHWYSTIFAIKNFVAAFHHAAIVITFIVLLMNRKGHFPFLNRSHLGDFSRYIFMLCIIWGYFWFAEFMLIWYANIPEETAYFLPRIRGEGWRIFFFANIIINWFVPFLLLMPQATARSKVVLKIVIPFLIIGQFIDLYIQIFPGTIGEPVLGFQEIGSFVGFAGLFMLVTGYVLSRASLYPGNHPYLEECQHHHT